MGTTTTPAQISTGTFNSVFLRYQAPNQKQNFRVRCALCPQEKRESRRLVSLSLVLLHCLSIPKHALAGGVFNKYMKRKKLDPLETYVPAIILTQVQIKELGKVLELDKPEYGACRNVLRAGPAGSLRVNIRAVAQYASESDNDSSASDNVDQCLRALEELDSLLLNASRNDPQSSVKSTMKSKIGIAIDALDKLLKTVPSEVLDKGQAIADAYLNNEEEGEDLAPQNLDPELKQLESVL